MLSGQLLPLGGGVALTRVLRALERLAPTAKSPHAPTHSFPVYNGREGGTASTGYWENYLTADSELTDRESCTGPSFPSPSSFVSPVLVLKDVILYNSTKARLVAAVRTVTFAYSLSDLLPARISYLLFSFCPTITTSSGSNGMDLRGVCASQTNCCS
ncbi:hypothetical protein J6590_012271 [Homalodisca vitripennis]|nr:hypothetical protein J6590_012271 [Homalodisca vitripennis]